MTPYTLFTEFQTDGILVIGCSDALGMSMDPRYRFSRHLAEHFKVEEMNLSLSGCSNDHILRTVLNLKSKPKLIILVFTNIIRREHYEDDGRLFYFNNGMRRDPNKFWEIFYELCNPFQDRVNFFTQFKSIEHILRGQNWLYSLTRNDKQLKSILTGINTERFLGKFEFIDFAPDGVHPGPKSHLFFYRKVLECLG